MTTANKEYNKKKNNIAFFPFNRRIPYMKGIPFQITPPHLTKIINWYEITISPSSLPSQWSQKIWIWMQKTLSSTGSVAIHLFAIHTLLQYQDLIIEVKPDSFHPIRGHIHITPPSLAQPQASHSPPSSVVSSMTPSNETLVSQISDLSPLRPLPKKKKLKKSGKKNLKTTDSMTENVTSTEDETVFFEDDSWITEVPNLEHLPNPRSQMSTGQSGKESGGTYSQTYESVLYEKIYDIWRNVSVGIDGRSICQLEVRITEEGSIPDQGIDMKSCQGDPKLKTLIIDILEQVTPFPPPPNAKSITLELTFSTEHGLSVEQENG